MSTLPIHDAPSAVTNSSDLETLQSYHSGSIYGRDRGKHVTQTISRLVDEMKDDLARLVSDTS